MEVISRLPSRERWPPSSCVVSPVGIFDLDDVGAEISQQHRTQRPSENPAEIDHFQVRKGRLAHFTHVVGYATVSSQLDLHS
jgi:hypothetical protein